MNADIQLRSRFPRYGVSGYGSQAIGTHRSGSKTVRDVFGLHTEAKYKNLQRPNYRNGKVRVIQPGNTTAKPVTAEQKARAGVKGTYTKIVIQHPELNYIKDGGNKHRVYATARPIA